MCKACLWTCLSKLPFPQLLLEDEPLPGELAEGHVFASEGIHCHSWYGVCVATCYPLQVDDVGFGIMRYVVLEARVAAWGFWLRVVNRTHCGRKEKQRRHLGMQYREAIALPPRWLLL